MKLGYFPLCLPQRLLIGKALGDRLPVHIASETVLGTVTGVIGLGTVTVRFAAATSERRNRAAAHVPQGGELLEQMATVRFQL